jgi:hypothetical protein
MKVNKLQKGTTTIKYLKDQLLAYMAAKPKVVKP